LLIFQVKRGLIPSTTITMVSIHRKKAFKTTVSMVSSNVIQKVVTIRNSWSTTQSPPPEEPRRSIPNEVHVRREIMEDFCCSRPVPFNVLVDDQDVASEVSLDFTLLGIAPKDRPPTPRPSSIRKTLSKFCIPEPRTTCGLSDLVDRMEWPSDEEDSEEEDVQEEDNNTLVFAGFLPSTKLDRTCGFDFWAPNQHTPSEAWGLSIVDRDDEEDCRFSASSREHNLISAGSTYDPSEPVGIFRGSNFMI
jgi:hypothetical protein